MNPSEGKNFTEFFIMFANVEAVPIKKPREGRFARPVDREEEPPTMAVGGGSLLLWHQIVNRTRTRGLKCLRG